MKEVIIIGGGLAGLINAILLSRKGVDVTVHEKKSYPFHKVCGEYISNEVLPFLKRENLYPGSIEIPQISRFQFTSIKGKSIELPLDLGGFGISRYYLDNFLKEKAVDAGVQVEERSAVEDIRFENDVFKIKLANGLEENSQLVLGAYGKRSRLDERLDRSFFKKRSPFIGVKYHIRTDFPKDKIALHNFQNGYCGISAVENDRYNLCYLGSRDLLRKSGDIESYEEAVLKENPFLRRLFENSDFIFERPEVINEFSFKPKSPVENHVLMSGDTAGLITPLCGNGMAMAIHSAQMLSQIILKNRNSGFFHLEKIEKDYTQKWKKVFKKRLWVGRRTQALFGSRITSEITVPLMKAIPSIAKGIIKNTHGQPF